MKVLLVNDLAAPVGGAERSTLELRDALDRAGHEARLFAAAPPELAADSRADRHCRGTLHPKIRVALQTANPWAARELARAIEELRPDVVHVRMFLTQLSPLILPVLRDVPTIYQAALYEAVCPITTKLLPDGRVCAVPAGRICLRTGCLTAQSWAAAMARLRMTHRWLHAFDAVVALSETVRRRLHANGITVDRVIGSGIPARAPRPPLTGSPTIAFAGRLVPAKGADVLLEAFARVRRGQPDARLLIAGDGPQRPALLQRVHDLGIADAVELPGHLDATTLASRIEHAWVQAVPGRWEEPFGRVVGEAMMRGTAVVATDLGGPAELVTDGETGRLVPPDDPAALADALTDIVSDRAQAEELGRAAHRHARDHLAEDHVLSQLEALYEEVVDRATTRGVA